MIEIEDAISQAERIPVGRPLYDRAQRLAARWKAESRDIAQLDRARDLARSGSPDALQAAIVEAGMIGFSNPKYKEARAFIDKNNTQLQTNQDQNILDQAKAIAAAGDQTSIQSAIDMARQIQSGRQLYSQAQAQIKNWSAALKSQDNSPDPLSTPQPTTPDTPLSQDDESLLSQANAMAQSGGGRPDELLSAISIAQQVSQTSRGQAQQLIEQWSGQVLNAAMSQAAYDAPGAISLASRVPAGTTAYSQAQSNIAAWKKQIGQR